MKKICSLGMRIIYAYIVIVLVAGYIASGAYNQKQEKETYLRDNPVCEISGKGSWGNAFRDYYKLEMVCGEYDVVVTNVPEVIWIEANIGDAYDYTNKRIIE